MGYMYTSHQMHDFFFISWLETVSIKIGPSDSFSKLHFCRRSFMLQPVYFLRGLPLPSFEVIFKTSTFSDKFLDLRELFFFTARGVDFHEAILLLFPSLCPSILVLAQVNVQVCVPKEHRPVTSDQALQERKRK